jgi:hypothetical protein
MKAISGRNPIKRTFLYLRLNRNKPESAAQLIGAHSQGKYVR